MLTFETTQVQGVDDITEKLVVSSPLLSSTSQLNKLERSKTEHSADQKITNYSLYLSSKFSTESPLSTRSPQDQVEISLCWLPVSFW